MLRKLLKRHGQPEAVVTDKLNSYGAALRELGVDAGSHETSGRWINNRAENSHLPLRRRERAMLRFRQMRSLQKFAAVHGSVHNRFNLGREFYSRHYVKENRTSVSTSGEIATCGPSRYLHSQTGSRLSDSTATSHLPTEIPSKYLNCVLVLVFGFVHMLAPSRVFQEVERGLSYASNVPRLSGSFSPLPVAPASGAPALRSASRTRPGPHRFQRRRFVPAGLRSALRFPTPLAAISLPLQPERGACSIHL
ncbi:DDE-type integrase/transposase/recombinase [Roseitalea porphyridii]|uniref:DDE-type integrase/transposase/recombinase n=1 Tax=Roseitalea porphyridii TaxID=1852022 RepID=UPI001AEC909C